MRPSLFQRLLRGRLLKFCLVGLSSTIIDKAIFYLLMTSLPALPWFISQSIAFIFGVTNGFFWNRKWTFAANDHDAMRRQYPKFVATNVVGLALNLFITKGFLILFTGQLKHDANADKNIILIASLCAVPLVVIWNFSASRLWTFKSAPSSPSNSAPLAPPR
ncbi:hypothetical protein IAD21_06185 [Abditibacteriota bacterium]|nr:hypothetical protein IAD21_06185 [Abditibacteriota bacterium]